MRSKKATMAAIILLVSLMSTGCVAKTTQIEEESMCFTVDIDGNRNPVADDDPRVVEMLEKTEGFIDAYAGRDYTNDNYLKEFDYYTKAVYEQRMAAKKPESTKATITNNKVQTTINSKESVCVQFYRLNGVEAATVTASYVSTMRCNDDYAEYLGIENNTPYQRYIDINFELEDGEWKVNSYDVSSRTKVN